MRALRFAVASLIALSIVALIALWPVAAAYIPVVDDSLAPDPVTITNYRADLEIDEDGNLTATETLTTQFPLLRHGIFRFWDLADPDDRFVRLVPRDIEVTMDGKKVPFELLWQKQRRYRVAKIGDPDSYVSSGEHVYRIKYTMKGVLAPPTVGGGQFDTSSWTSDEEDQSAVFYWNVVAQGWQMSIGSSEVHIKFPVETGEVKCAVGYSGGSGVACRIDGAGTDEVTIRTGALQPRTPVTVRADLGTPLPDRETRLWPLSLDPVFGSRIWLVPVVLLLAVAGFLLGLRRTLASREEEPGYPVSYVPPEGLGPVQTYYVMHERVPPNALTATLMHQAQQGLTTLTEHAPRNWTITGIAERDAWERTDPITRHVGATMGMLDKGTFNADGSVGAGSKLNSVISGIDTVAKDWAFSSGLLEKRPDERRGILLVVLAAILTCVFLFWNPLHMTMLALVPAGYAITGSGLFRTGVGMRRTLSGREAWARAGGFHRLLSTPSAKDRFDFSAHRELYTVYIPYAVAFDCAEEWARKYELTVGEPAPIPTWYGGSPSGGGFWSSGSSFAGFESSLRSSISAYEATQRSSSSGGGGGGGGGCGGGGGGGGGGSW